MCLRHAEVTGKPARARGAAASQAAASSEPSCQPVMADSSTEVTGVAPGGLDGVSSQALPREGGEHLAEPGRAHPYGDGGRPGSC